MLRKEFAVIRVNKDRGVKHVREGINYLQRQRGRGIKSWNDEPIDDFIRRREEGVDESVEVFIADSETPGEAYLVTTLSPDEPIFFGYHSPQNEIASRPLLERCSKVLGYSIE